MGAMASQITSLTIVYSSVYSAADQRKHQSSASLAFVRWIYWGPVKSPHKWPVTRKCFHMMTSLCSMDAVVESIFRVTECTCLNPSPVWMWYFISMCRDISRILSVSFYDAITRLNQSIESHINLKENLNYFDVNTHDDVIKWKHSTRYWPFVRRIHRSPVNSPHEGQWRGALIFSLICVWVNGWVNNREVGDLIRHRAHYDVIVMHESSLPFYMTPSQG